MCIFQFMWYYTALFVPQLAVAVRFVFTCLLFTCLLFTCLLFTCPPSYTPVSTSKGPRKFYTFYGHGKSRYEKEQRDREELEAYLATLEAGRQYPSSVLDALRNMDMNEINLQLVMELVKHLCRSMGPGAILIFLPGGCGFGLVLTSY